MTDQPRSNAVRAPGATYRVQFHAGFTLRDVLAIVPYLHALGVTHLYASPILKARPGSTHGYDVLDHSALNPEIGSEADLAELSRALRDRGMGLLLDAVPNHMSVGTGNAWWADVLEHGPASSFAAAFDIAWHDSPRPQMAGRLLLPVLGDQYGAVLESGEFQPVFEEGGFHVRVHDNRLPLDPRTYGQVLAPASRDVRERHGAEHPSAIELASILHAVQGLPPRTDPDEARQAEGRLEVIAIRRRLSELAERFPEAAAAVAGTLTKLAGTPGDPTSFAALDELLEAQAYRPCFWRVASDEINYRRFFDVNDLAALSTERREVFAAVHSTWFRWLREGIADGLRIDHPDGLFDPKEYLARLQTSVGRTPPGPTDDGTGHNGAGGLYVVVEKILGDGEELPAAWECAGTTGYEFIHALNGLFVDPASEGALTNFYQQFTGLDDPWPEVVYRSKRQATQGALASELNALAHQLDRIARLDRRSRDFTLNGIRKALREVVACFPVYRSYVNGSVGDTDKAVVGKATRWAYRRNPVLGKAVFDFIRDTVLLKDSPSGPASEEYHALQRRFAGKFQQVTSPVAAKGVEDTAFYVFNRLVSLNEVGGEPGKFGWKPEQVHAFLHARAAAPGGLSPLSTHDTKRGEDVRARLNVLSELTAEWTQHVSRWSGYNRAHKTEVDDRLAPDANEEYLLYQTLVGAWPGRAGVSDEFRQRIRDYMKKALAEAKVHTSWINPNAEYEAAVAAFIDRTLDPQQSDTFLLELDEFADRVAGLGRINSLAQTLIRCTAPGVPDTYQGTESWDLSLVDPDNRRPVDYTARASWLHELDTQGTAAADLARNLADPRAKLFVTATALRCRRDQQELFAHGDYVPVEATGERGANAFAFLRTSGTGAALVVTTRLPASLRDGWGGTALTLPSEWADAAWKNLLTGELISSRDAQLPLSEVLKGFPVALLICDTGT
ncbi:Maltooligosyl trehalose synthase [Gemmata obscuriglobus]|uniref:Malto-oligosyltrehalose synthase n=1 Tax=Gemmata obscuriglobus TaxID=114 RepID=A0A2Z3GZI5_9BACT|nr:malto-oligosyltrehalose synthase [Gemmata obscuriglobus]AWM38868.1 malto-oligosyltrehalose synthase [Gemmata obscuriglobus]QEG28130.1 Maltooligosyl trehalose synthase [Gemmata obscuriglobus]VTS05793.1 malto-oligosyltrehalose synthase : Malto-oligosyltrehalose synthase OS=Oscillochloris trichoides DG-6 GN=OSCT_2032 PE=4 SV=1: Alpha-amylase [Gemmata obscuriglobus UQM 2246]